MNRRRGGPNRLRKLIEEEEGQSYATYGDGVTHTTGGKNETTSVALEATPYGLMMLNNDTTTMHGYEQDVSGEYKEEVSNHKDSVFFKKHSRELGPDMTEGGLFRNVRGHRHKANGVTNVVSS